MTSEVPQFSSSYCFNCGRGGVVPGQMIMNKENHAFCSRDCGWSYLLRPLDRHYAAKMAAAAAAAAAAANNTSTATTSTRRSSRRTRPSKHLPQAHAHEQIVSARRPPQPTRQTPSAASKDPAEDAFNSLHAGNAMFDFCMMFDVE